MALEREIEWRVAARRSTLKAQPEGWAKTIRGAWEKLKARARALVEPPFHIIKNIFRHRKVRYRGLEKNTAQLRVLFALANLSMVRRQLAGSAAAWAGHPRPKSLEKAGENCRGARNLRCRARHPARTGLPAGKKNSPARKLRPLPRNRVNCSAFP